RAAIAFLDVRHDPRRPAHQVTNPALLLAAGRKRLVRIVIQMQRRHDLPDMVLARRGPRSLPGRLHCRQQQCNEYPNDRNDDQQLNKRERRASIWMLLHGKLTLSSARYPTAPASIVRTD